MADVFDGAFTEVVNVNGEKQTIPTEWLGTPMGEGFTVASSSAPSEEWTVPELREYADAQGIDLTGAGSAKAGILARINQPITGDPAQPGEE